MYISNSIVNPFQVRLMEYQCGVVRPSIPDYSIKRMYISNSIVNPFQVRLMEYQCGVVKPSVPDYIIKKMYISNSIVNPFQVRLMEYQCGVVRPSVPDYIIKRMYISNSIVNPLLSIAFYMSGIIMKLCKCVKPTNQQQGTNTAVSNYWETSESMATHYFRCMPSNLLISHKESPL